MNKKLVPVRFIVQRDVRDEIVIAIITANVGKSLENQMDFLAVLKFAITRWIDSTKEGLAAWRESCEDFNVGDLSNYYENKALKAILKNLGIHNLELGIVSQNECSYNWTYDTVLATPVPMDVPMEQ